MNYEPRTWDPLKVPTDGLIYPKEAKYDPNCPVPWVMQDTVNEPGYYESKQVFSPRSMAPTLYNERPNSHPPMYQTKINNALYGADFSRYEYIQGMPRKITDHFKLYPRSDYRPYEYRQMMNCILPVMTQKNWTHYPIITPNNC